ncbi:MAG: hypothetical protein ACRCX2_18310 [Paraclostridium sp.]
MKIGNRKLKKHWQAALDITVYAVVAFPIAFAVVAGFLYWCMSTPYNW